MINSAVKALGKRYLAMHKAVAERALVYIGCTDCNFIAEGAVLLQYNVIAKNHTAYKSTVAFRHNWK